MYANKWELLKAYVEGMKDYSNGSVIKTILKKMDRLDVAEQTERDRLMGKADSAALAGEEQV